MMKKMTYVEALSRVINGGAVTPEVIEKLEALRASIEKRSGAERKPTAKQNENAVVREALIEFINENAKGDGFTVTDLLKSCPAVEGKSNQYASALLRQAVEAGRISRGSVKRRTYFAPVGKYPAPATEVEGE